MSKVTRRTSKKGIGGFEYHPSKDGRVRWRMVSKELGGQRFRSSWCSDAESAYADCLTKIDEAKAQSNIKYPSISINGKNVNEMYVHELLLLYARQSVIYSMKDAGSKTYGTHQSQENLANRFKKFYPNIKVKEVTASKLYEWRQDLEKVKTPTGKYYSKQGIGKFLGFVKCAFEFAYDMKYIRTNVVSRNNFSAKMYKYIFDRSHDKAHIAAFTAEQVQYLLDLDEMNRDAPILDLRYKTLFKLQFLTGLRISEALGLTWDRVEGNNLHVTQQFEPQAVQMPANWKDNVAYDNDSGIKAETKTRKTRIIPLPESFIIYIGEYRKWLSDQGASVFGNDVMFPSKGGSNGRLPNGSFASKPMTKGSVNRQLLKCMIATGKFTDEELYDDEKKLRTHSFRRGTGTSLADNGIDVQTISNILGHSNLHTLKAYVNPSTQRQHDLKLNALEGIAARVS